MFEIPYRSITNLEAIQSHYPARAAAITAVEVWQHAISTPPQNDNWLVMPEQLPGYYELDIMQKAMASNLFDELAIAMILSIREYGSPVCKKEMVQDATVYTLQEGWQLSADFILLRMHRNDIKRLYGWNPAKARKKMEPVRDLLRQCAIGSDTRIPCRILDLEIENQNDLCVRMELPVMHKGKLKKACRELHHHQHLVPLQD